MARAGTVAGLVLAMALLICVDASRSRPILEERAEPEQGTKIPAGVHSRGEQGTWALDIAAGDHVDLPGSSIRGSRSTVLIVAGVVLAVAGVGVVMMAFPVVLVCIVRMLGFTAQGIAAGSRAAFIMSLHGGRVAVGSVCAICQSIGALGVAGVTAVCACGPVIPIAVALSLLTIGLLCFLFHTLHDLFQHLSNFFKELGNTILERLHSL